MTKFSQYLKNKIAEKTRVYCIRKTSPRLKNINKKIAIQIHVFYVDLLDELYKNLVEMPFEFDLYISTDTILKKGKIELFFKSKKIVPKVCVFENRGRDIYPFLEQMHLIIQNYDYILHLHTKKSKYDTYGDAWRQYLYSTLLGNRNNIASIFYQFERKKGLGIIFPVPYESIKGMMQMGGSKQYYDILCDRLNIKEQFNNVFPAGSMFWAKVDSILPLFYAFNKFDFPSEKNQRDGTFAHAVERIFVVLALSRGYTYLEIKNFSRKNR